jgi:type IV/VI secretion system ImpK/VasF family protein
MSGGADGPRSSRTIFRRSPLQEMKAAEAEPQTRSRPGPSSRPFQQGTSDDMPVAPPPAVSRNPLLRAALPLLALLASIRTGRAEIAVPDLYGFVSTEIDRFSEAARRASNEESAKRAAYALCATADDIVLNLPGHEADAAEWARRSIAIRYFGERVGGDRFWTLLDEMISRPAGFYDAIELYHACMACGFMGRLRGMPSGKTEHEEMMQKAFRALDHPDRTSSKELSPHWRGMLTQLSTLRIWTPLAAAGAGAAALLVLVYCGLLFALSRSDAAGMSALSSIDDQPRVQLARAAVPPPVQESTKLQRIRKYLAPEIQKHSISVAEDASVIRVTARSSTLFASGSADLLQEAQLPLLRIADALRHERGRIVIEGHSDNQRITASDLVYSDNQALSLARAETVSDLIRKNVDNPARVRAAGFGDSRPIASNATPQGRALNRRVEVTIAQGDE